MIIIIFKLVELLIISKPDKAFSFIEYVFIHLPGVLISFIYLYIEIVEEGIDSITKLFPNFREVNFKEEIIFE